MKKRSLAMLLALVLCLGLAVPALAAEPKAGDTTVTDAAGVTYTFSQPILGTEQVKFNYTLDEELLEFIDWTFTEMPQSDYAWDGGCVFDKSIAERSKGEVTALLVPMGTRLTASSGQIGAIKEDTAVIGANAWINDLIEFSPDIVLTEEDLARWPDSDTWYEIFELGGDEYGIRSMEFKPGAVFFIYNYHEGRGSKDGVKGGIFVKLVDAASTPAPSEPVAPPDPVTPAAPAFTDVPSWEYYAKPVAWAVEKGVTDGTTPTTFSPDDDCTQVQILTFLWRAADKPTSSAALPVDITGKNVDYAADALRWAAEKGMIDGTFDVSAKCTRAAAVTYIWQARGGLDAGAAGFTDVSADAWYAPAVAWAVENGVTDGTSPTTFSPGDVCTRGQIVTFLHRAYVPEARLK